MKIIHIMKTQIELQIGGKWYKVAKVENLTNRLLNAIIDSYACVEAYRVKYEGKITQYNEL